MKKLALIVAITLNMASAFASTESDNLEGRTRCGWIEFNRIGPSYSLDDIDGLWTIGNEEFQAKGDFPSLPEDKDQYVSTMNGEYFCGCLHGTFDVKNKDVLGIFSARSIQLSQCVDWAKQKDNISKEYKMVSKVSSMGKAYTECQDPDEMLNGFNGRKICVNQAGEYYYLAE